MPSLAWASWTWAALVFHASAWVLDHLSGRPEVWTFFYMPWPAWALPPVFAHGPWSSCMGCCPGARARSYVLVLDEDLPRSYLWLMLQLGRALSAAPVLNVLTHTTFHGVAVFTYIPHPLSFFSEAAKLFSFLFVQPLDCSGLIRPLLSSVPGSSKLG